MRLLIACLSSYNKGINHGVWVTPNTSEVINQQIDEMLKESPVSGAEEWDIVDSVDAEGINTLSGLIKFHECCQEHGEAVTLAALRTYGPIGFEYFVTLFHGGYENLETFAHEFFQELPDYEAFADYLDVAKIVRTKQHEGWRLVQIESGEYYAFNGGKH